MADIATDITILSNSFGTIIDHLKNYSGNESGLIGKDAISLNGIISGLSSLQIKLEDKDANGISRIDNIKNFQWSG